MDVADDPEARAFLDLLTCSLNTTKPRHETKEICYRQLKAIDIDALHLDLEESDLCSSVYRDLNELTSVYQSTLSILLEKHAPLKKKVKVCRQRVPWFNRARRVAERKWRRTKSQHDLRAFKDPRSKATRVMNKTRCEFHTDLIAENSTDQRKLFRIIKSLLRGPSEVSFPKHISPADLANSFGHYFVQKIDINTSLDDPSPSLASEAGERDCTALDGFTGATFADFKAVKKKSRLLNS